MKNLSLTFLFLILFCFTAFSQYQADAQIKGAERIRIDEKSKAIKYFKLKVPESFSASGLPVWLKDKLKAGNDDDFTLIKMEHDQLHQNHYRFQQTYKGIPIKNAVYYVHTKDQKIVSANGHFVPNMDLEIFQNITTEEAIEIGKAHMPGEFAMKADEFPTPDLMIYMHEDAPHLVLRTDIYTTKPLARKYLMIDAKDGKVLHGFDRIHHHDSIGKLETRNSGTRHCTVDSLSANSFRLRDNSRGDGVFTWDLNTSTSYGNAVDFTDTDNCWNTTTNKDDAGYDVHWASVEFFDFLFEEFNRNSYDNTGTTINSYVHYGDGFNNAFWNGDGLTYGDGNSTTRDAYTSVDVIGHEIMHAVTEHTADLIYQAESGALNESFSDIFGTALDFRLRPAEANFLIGEEFNLEGSMIRNMGNPNEKDHPDTYFGDHWETSSFDNYGVHINSGVQNFWYYLLCVGGTGTNDNGDNYGITSIGMEAATAISYRNLSVYLTPSSQYDDARFFAIEAAIDLYGECSDEVINVTNAWAAVGVGQTFSNAVIANFEPSVTYACVTPATIEFQDFSTNATSFLWDFGDGNSSTAQSPTHTYTAPGTYTITLTTTGSAICGNSDMIVEQDLITVTNDNGPASATCVGSIVNPTSNTGIFSFDYLVLQNDTEGSIAGHEDFTCEQPASVMEGIFHPVTVQTSAEENIAIWADLDGNGTFEDNELAYRSYTATANHNFEMAIPKSTIYDAPVRLRIKSDNNTSTSLDVPCENMEIGQTEDYTILVSENSLPVIADFETENPTILFGANAQFIDKSLNAPTSWSWQFTGGFPNTSTEKNPSINFPALGTYPVTLTVTNAQGSDSKTINIDVVSQVDLCTGASTSNAPNGVLFDSGGPNGNYSNAEDCSILINPSCAQQITLSFVDFELETSFDFLRVYDGVDDSAPLLLSATGTILPDPVTTTGSAMFVRFTSDGSVTDPGFEANWVSTIPDVNPVADFDISNVNPPLNSEVVFTDQSTNLPNLWNWDFGDGNTSTLQNPTHQYLVPGTYTVTLIVDNCLAQDTHTQTVVVQQAANISLNVNMLSATVNCGESASQGLIISNTGVGDGSFSINNPTASISETSEIPFDFDNFTLHTFTGIPPITTTEITVEVLINGDFDDGVEFATVFIDNNEVGVIDGGDPNGTDIIATYTFDSSEFTPWLSDGILDIRVENSADVDLGLGGTDIHRVTVNTVGTSWLTSNPNGGIIAGNNSQTVNVQFDATNLVAGIYTETLIVETSDANSPSIAIPVTFEVLGTAEMEFPFSCLNFSNIMQFTSETLSLPISNPSCAALDISNIGFGDMQFSTSINQLTIPAFSTDTIQVTFNPMNPGNFTSTITFDTNIGMNNLCISGSSFAAPIISVEPTNASLDLNSCSDNAVVSITVENVGANNLIFDFTNQGSNGSELDSVRSRLNASFTQITDLLPNFFLFLDGEVGTSIGDGGGDMYDTGNILSFNDGNALSYSNDVIIPDLDLGTDGQYFTRKHPGLFVFAADISNQNSFEIKGNLGADGSGVAEATNITHTHQGVNYRGFVKRVFNSFDPSINHLIILRDEPGLAQTTLAPNTTNEDHQITGINNTSRIYYLLFAEEDSGMYTDQQFEAVMIKFLEIVENGGFGNPPTGTFSVGANQTQTIDIPYNITNIPGGQYVDLIQISSNDPLNPFVEIPITLNVSFDLCADFGFAIPNDCGGEVNFTSNVINTPSSYLWDFGDGNTSNQSDPTHVYTAPGNYQVQLTVSSANSTDMITYTVTIDDVGSPISACEIPVINATIFDDISSFTLNTIQNVSGSATTSYTDYTCDFQTTLTGGVEYTLELESPTTGTQDVGVYIDYNNNGVFTTNERVMFLENANEPHIQSFTVPTSGVAIGVPLRLRAIIDDSFETIGPCTVPDDGEAEDYTVFVESNTMPPISSFNFDIMDDCQGIVQFTDLSTNVPTSWFWDFGDGNTSGIQNPIHTFPEAGIYTVTLTTTNDFGMDEFTINVTTNSLTASIDAPDEFVLNEPLTFTAESAGAISWDWNFGDGTSGSGESVEHTYTDLGTYTVILSVVNGVGCTNSTQLTFDVTLTDIEDIISDVSIYPNPSDGNLVIENLGNYQYQQIEVFNNIGQIVRNINVENASSHYLLQLEELPAGLYWIQLNFGDEGSFAEKIMIVKDK